MAITEERKGEAYLAAEIVTWAFFPVVTVLTIAIVPSIVSLVWSTLFAALFFAIVITYRKKWHEMRDTVLLRYAVYIAILIGFLAYGFFFLALESTTPGNAAIIGLLEVFSASLFFRFVQRERQPRSHVVGAMLMVAGGVIILAPQFSGVNVGDLFMLGLVVVTPLGNLYQQKARARASSEMVMFLRSALSIPLMLLLAYVLKIDVVHTDISAVVLLLLINGVLFLGLSKLWWLEAIHRIAVPKALALNSVGVFGTLLLAWLVLGQTPTVYQIASLIPLIIGTLLLTDHLRLGALTRRIQ